MMRWVVRASAIVLAFAVALGVMAVDLGLSGAANEADLKSLLLQADDLGASWTRINLGSTTRSQPSCLATFDRVPKGIVRAQVQFQHAGAVPLLSEELQAGPGTGTRFTAAVAALSSCSTMSLTVNGQTIEVVLQPVAGFPQIGSASSAFTGAAQVASTSVGLDIVLFRVGNVAAELLYVGQGTPNEGQVAGYAQDALAHIQAQPITPDVSS